MKGRRKPKRKVRKQMANKVRFGAKNLHIGKMTESGGSITMGQPLHIPGTTKIGADPITEEMLFHADNVVYKEDHEDQGYEIEIETAGFPDEFKVDYLGYIELDDGGVAMDRNAERDRCYIAFESGGDANPVRGILYNVALGQIKTEHATIEKTKTPETETLTCTCFGDDQTGIVKVGYDPGSDTYEDLLTDPPAPLDLSCLVLLDDEGEELLDDESDEPLLGQVELQDIEVYFDDEVDISQVISSSPQTLGGPGMLRPQLQPLDGGRNGLTPAEELTGGLDLEQDEILTDDEPDPDKLEEFEELEDMEEPEEPDGEVDLEEDAGEEELEPDEDEAGEDPEEGTEDEADPEQEEEVIAEEDEEEQEAGEPAESEEE